MMASTRFVQTVAIAALTSPTIKTHPMPAKAKAVSAISGGQAQYVLRRLIEERRITAKDVERHAGEMQREIAALEERLRMLREVADEAPVGRGRRRERDGTSSEEAAEPRRRRKGRRRRKQNLSPERRAALQLQGRYMALIRKIPARKQSQYKKLLRTKGKEAAIKAMQQATSK